MANQGNVLLIGNSGVGKSTLINAVIGDEIAYTSIGTEGTTKEIKIYPQSESENNLSFRLIDTMGFEASSFKIRKAIRQVKKWTKEGAQNNNEDHQINAIWFCVEGTSGKLFPETIKNMLKATSIWKSIPVIVVITKSYSKPERAANIEMVRDAYNKFSTDPERLKGIIPVVAKTYVIDGENGNFSPAEGIEELISITNSILPEGKKASQNDIASYNLNRKRVFAHGLVSAATVSAGVVGAIPIPFADAAILVPIETGMLLGISKIYGIKSDVKSSVFLKTIVDTGTVSVAAKALISAIKAIPGINIAASIINAVIASSIVAAIGEVSIYAYEQVYLGNKTLEDIDWIKKLVEKALQSKDTLKKVEKILKKIGKEKNLKKIAKIIFDVFKESKGK